MMLQSIDNELSIRTLNILKNANINCIEDIKNISFNQLINLKNIRQKHIKEIINTLNKFNLYFFNKDFEKYTIDNIINKSMNSIKEINSIVGNRKVNLLITLIENSGSTFGEKKNSLLAIQKILKIDLHI